MKYLKNKIEKILYQKRYDIENKEEWFFLKYKNQVLWAFEYITNQKELFWDFDSRWIEKIPKEYINDDSEIFLWNKNIFICFAKRKNIKNENIYFADFINIETNASQRIQISKINLIYNFKYDNSEYLLINYTINDENLSIVLEINTLNKLKKISEKYEFIKLNYFKKDNNFYKLEYINSNKNEKINELNTEFYFELKQINEIEYNNAIISEDFFDFYSMQLQINKNDLIFWDREANSSTSWNAIKTWLNIFFIFISIIFIFYKPILWIFFGVFISIFMFLDSNKKFKLINFSYVIVLFSLIIEWFTNNFYNFIDLLLSISFIYAIIIIPLIAIRKNKIIAFETKEINDLEKYSHSLEIKNKLQNINYNKINEHLILIISISLMRWLWYFYYIFLYNYVALSNFENYINTITAFIIIVIWVTIGKHISKSAIFMNHIILFMNNFISYIYDIFRNETILNSKIYINNYKYINNKSIKKLINWKEFLYYVENSDCIKIKDKENNIEISLF